MIDLLNDYAEVRECDYKGEHYSVRDNGAVMRHPKFSMKYRMYDAVWTFGKKNQQNGYMYLGSHRVHIIVAIAFLGYQDSKVYVVDHIDTNRCNNRCENLRWKTRAQNALENEITRNKIISICGSIEAFIENPNILREKITTPPSLAWMATVTKEEAAIAYENCKRYWAEQAANPKPFVGKELDKRIYTTQNNIASATNSQPVDKPSSALTDDEWNDMVKSLNANKESNASEAERVVCSNIIMSLTPKAAQERNFNNDKPCVYPSTPQGEYNNPLKAYADALSEGCVFWQNHEGKRPYIFEKCDMSIDGQSLIVMTKAGYVWTHDETGDMVETPTSKLSKNEYKDDDLLRQLIEVVYENGIFVHKRIEVGHLPKEYLEQIYNKKTIVM